MRRSVGGGLALALGVSLGLGACGVESTGAIGDKADQDIGVGVTSVQSALHDGFTTPFIPFSSITVGTDRVFAVWMAQDASGVPQVAGQMFTLTGQAVTASQLYSTGTDAKGQPAVSYNGSGGFLITYLDLFMNGTDTDVWGILLNSIGTKVSQFHVNFDSTKSSDPSIAVVPTPSGVPRWLVSYTDTPGSGTASYSFKVNYVDAQGNVAPWVQIAQNSETPDRPMAVYGSNSGRLLFSLSPKFFAFADALNLTVGPVQAVPALGAVKDKSVSYNPSSGTFAMAWHDMQPSGQVIRTRTFSSGCESFSCADQETSPSPIRMFTGISDFSGADIVPLGSGFAIFAGMKSGTASDVDFSWIDGHGHLGAIFPSGSMLPCPPGVTRVGQATPGFPERTLSAASAGATGRAFISYATACSPGNQVSATGWDLSFTKVQFPVSD